MVNSITRITEVPQFIILLLVSWKISHDWVQGCFESEIQASLDIDFKGASLVSGPIDCNSSEGRESVIQSLLLWYLAKWLAFSSWSITICGVNAIGDLGLIQSHQCDKAQLQDWQGAREGCKLIGCVVPWLPGGNLLTYTFSQCKNKSLNF